MLASKHSLIYENNSHEYQAISILTIEGNQVEAKTDCSQCKTLHIRTKTGRKKNAQGRN
jgi:hypothetical protein